MPTRVGTHQAKTSLSEYLNRVAYAGERIVIERHGKPVAALIGLDDLQRLEALEAARSGTDELAAREREFRRRLQERGVVVRWPTGAPVPPEERRLIQVEGPPISEQIIAERR